MAMRWDDLNPDPPRRADGLCACGCGRPLQTPRKGAIQALRQALAADPFATTDCAKEYFGVVTLAGQSARKPR